jgi:hypothetical protein
MKTCSCVELSFRLFLYIFKISIVVILNSLLIDAHYNSRLAPVERPCFIFKKSNYVTGQVHKSTTDSTPEFLPATNLIVFDTLVTKILDLICRDLLCCQLRTLRLFSRTPDGFQCI